MSLSVRNVASCCPRKARVEAVTRWTATSCARAAALAASRTSRPKSPPTADRPVATVPFFLKPLPLSQIHEQLHINDSTDKKRSSFVQSYFFLFFFFPPTCLLWVLINFAVGPSGGIKQQFHFFFCYFDEATTSFHPEVLLHFPSFLVHMFSSVINSGLTCRQLGLHLPFIHTGTAQQLACTLLLSLSKTMNVWKDIIDLDLRSGRWCFFRREVA